MVRGKHEFQGAEPFAHVACALYIVIRIENLILCLDYLVYFFFFP